MFRLGLAAWILAICVIPMAASAASVSIYNWADYIAPDTLDNFHSQTGISTRYAVYDSNETLLGQLQSGKPSYDVVFPSNHFLARQIKAGLLKTLDRSRLPNWKYLNPVLLRALEPSDPGNRHGFPYLWGSSGIGYDEAKVRAVLGASAPVDSWDLVFQPGNMARLASCGVAMIDSSLDLVPMALNYLGLSPYSHDPEDYRKAETLLMGIKPYVRYFDSFNYAHDLSDGKVCVVVGFSGDVLQAKARARQAGKGVNIRYAIPREGSTMWFDMAVIPANASDEDAAYAYLDYLLEPKVIANITNTVRYANGNEGADEWLDADIQSDRQIYPRADMMSKLFILQPVPEQIDQLRSAIWARVRQ